METVNFLAELWGFSLVIVCLSFLVKPGNIKTLFQLATNEAIVLLVGILNLILGIALVLSYHGWDLSWRTLITILAFLPIARGVLILFFPERFAKLVAKFKDKNDWISLAMVLCVVFGCFLIYAGFFW